MSSPRFLIVGESAADCAAVRVLVEGILGHAITLVDAPIREPRGWPHVAGMLPVLIKAAQYKTDADILVVVADTNGTTLSDDPIQGVKEGNRLAQMRQIADQTLRDLKTNGRDKVRVILGAAAPAMEAWLLPPGQDLNEAAWEKLIRTERGRIATRKRELKEQLYGHANPTLEHETERMVDGAKAAAGRLEDLKRRFPVGFGQFAEQLKRI